MTPFLYLLALGLALGGVAVRLYLWSGSPRTSGEAPGPAFEGRFSSGFRALAAALFNARLLARGRGRWAAHSLIFLGALHPVGAIIHRLGLTPWLDLKAPPVYWTFTALRLLLLVGIALVIYRRAVQRPPQLRTSRGQWAVLGFLGALALTGILLGALDLAGVDTQTSLVRYFHRALALGLIVYLPWSPLLHMVASPLAQVMARAGGNSRAFLQAVELDSCTRCGECQRVCDTYTGPALTSPYIRLKTFGCYRAAERLPHSLARLLGGRKPGNAELKDFSLDLYRCTLCGRCQAVCPVRIGLRDLWLSLRQEMVGRGVHPAGLDKAREAIATTRNVVAYPNEERATWVDFAAEPPADGYRREKAEWVYFVGCMASFSPAVQGIPEAFTRLLTRAGVDFTLLGEEEWCCGFPLIVAGMPEAARELMEHNLQRVKATGARGVLFSCPSCYRTWNNEYRPHLDGLELLHSTQLLERLVSQGEIAFQPLGKKVTYHDPCDLGRNGGVFDAPRQVLYSVPELTLVEIGQNREMGLCCGGGGDHEIVDPDLCYSVADRTWKAIQATGADIVITACQQCQRTLLQAREKAGDQRELLDITQLAARLVREP